MSDDSAEAELKPKKRHPPIFRCIVCKAEANYRDMHPKLNNAMLSNYSRHIELCAAIGEAGWRLVDRMKDLGPSIGRVSLGYSLHCPACTEKAAAA